MDQSPFYLTSFSSSPKSELSEDLSRFQKRKNLTRRNLVSRASSLSPPSLLFSPKTIITSVFFRTGLLPSPRGILPPSHLHLPSSLLLLPPAMNFSDENLPHSIRVQSRSSSSSSISASKPSSRVPSTRVIVTSPVEERDDQFETLLSLIATDRSPSREDQEGKGLESVGGGGGVEGRGADVARSSPLGAGKRANGRFMEGLGVGVSIDFRISISYPEEEEAGRKEEGRQWTKLISPPCLSSPSSLFTFPFLFSVHPSQHLFYLPTVPRSPNHLV